MSAEVQRKLERLILQIPTELGRSAARLALSHAIQTGEKSVLEQITAPPGYDRRPVSMRQFLEDSDYMGAVENLWPDIKADLIRLFDEGRYVEAIISGSIGSGKSTFTSFAYARMLYELSCIADPAAFYGLIPGSTVYLVNQSVNLNLAKKVIFGEIKQRLRESPYFKTYFAADPHITSELHFPKHVVVLPLASGDTSALGLNVFGGTLDEAAFYAVVEKSKKARSVNENYDVAEKMYTAISRRLRSRFMQAGGQIPGKLFLVSSANYDDDFMERKKKEARTDSVIYVRQKALWQTKVIAKPVNADPEKYDDLGYSKETFPVEIGGPTGRPRLLTAADEISGEVIHVPVDFLNDFKKDIIGAVRDIAGRATSAIDPFLPDVTPLRYCIDTDRVHPATAPTTNLQDGVRLLTEHLAIFDKEANRWKPKFHPGATRFAHVDYALTNDECGVAIGCSPGQVVVERRDSVTMEMRKFNAPIIHIDLMMKIVPPAGGEIDLEEVRSMFIYTLIGLGFWIKRVTFDQFASQEAMQQLRKRSIESEHLSVDTDMTPYITWKTAVQEHRCRTYEYSPYSQEAAILEIDRKKRKVDHPPGKDKGVTDAVASVCEQVTIDAAEHITGLYDYRKQQVEAAMEENKRRLQKPAVNDQTESCPGCGSKAIVNMRGVKRCNQCGEILSNDAKTTDQFKRKDLLK